MAVIGAKEAAGIAEAMIDIVVDYYKSNQEPEQEVVAAWRRIARRVDEGNALVQAIEPVRFIPQPEPR